VLRQRVHASDTAPVGLGCVPEGVPTAASTHVSCPARPNVRGRHRPRKRQQQMTLLDENSWEYVQPRRLPCPCICTDLSVHPAPMLLRWAQVHQRSGMTSSPAHLQVCCQPFVSLGLPAVLWHLPGKHAYESAGKESRERQSTALPEPQPNTGDQGPGARMYEGQSSTDSTHSE
jgi:hypothetical protein